MRFSIRQATGRQSSLVLPALAMAVLAATPGQAQDAAAGRAIMPAEQTAAAVADPDWTTPLMSWGDPNLEGTFTSRDMSGISMERQPQYGNRASMTSEEFQRRATGGPGGLVALRGGEEFEGEARLQLSALDSGETGTRTFGYTSYIIEPADGRMPGLTEEGQRLQASRGGGGQANGPFFTMSDFSYYDRCITRGVVGSIMPSLYGDAMRIVQSPTEVAISYEMLHDTRIIPIDGTEHADTNVKQYMGTSTGHWEGDTLVIETRNFTDKLNISRYAHSDDLVLTERITRIDPEMINYVVTVNDPRTFEQPWSYRLTLTTQPDYEILEYSCHEGNFFVANALRAEMLYQERVAEAMANGDPIPARSIDSGGGLSIYEAPSASDAIDINASE